MPETLCILPVALILFIATNRCSALDLGDACRSDTDCGTNAVCWRYPVSPACDMGTCTCKAKFYQSSRSSSDCFPRINMTLNSPCVGDELEQYPAGASCYAGRVQCKMQYEPKNNTACGLRRSVQSDYGYPCTSNAQCNPTIGLFCNLAWQACTCYSNYMWTGKVCEEAYYGSNCVTDDNCQTGGAYTVGGPGNGGICSDTDHTCACDRGFQAVNFTQYYRDFSGDTLDMIQSTWTICVASQLNTVKLGPGEQCTVPIWSSAIPVTNQRYCRAGLACIVCPETQRRADINGTQAIGTCRNGASAVHSSHFGAASLLTAIYAVAYIVKLLTVVIGV